MVKALLLTFLSISFCTFAQQSKPLHSFFTQIEPLIKEGKFDEAKAEFRNIENREAKQLAVENGFYEVLEYLEGESHLKRGAYYNHLTLSKARQHPEDFELMGSSGIVNKDRTAKVMRYDIEKELPRKTPFSPEFQQYIFTNFGSSRMCVF